jgi:hypothetical protein
VTFSVVYRTREGVQRWQKLERFPILTPHLARQEAIRVLRDKTQPAKGWLSGTVLRSQTCATNISNVITEKSRARSGAIGHASNCTLSQSWVS